LVLPQDSRDAFTQLAAAFIPEFKLSKTAEQLISGSLKRSSSFRSELASKTYREILTLAKENGPQQQAARRMKKLIEQSSRILEKVRGKP